MTIQEILEAHDDYGFDPISDSLRQVCACSKDCGQATRKPDDVHRAHVAEVLELYVHQTRRGVWDRAYFAGWNDEVWRDNPYTGKEASNGR